MLKSPFFIVGCGRSGTTLLRTILNHHPKVAIPLESLFIIDYLRSGSRVPPEKLRELMTMEFEISEWGMRVTSGDLKDCTTAKELIDKVHDLYAAKHGKVIWGQKVPRFVRFGDLLKSNYPRAKFIHLIRDPRAVVSSLIRSNVHRSNAYYASLRWLKDVRAGLDLKERYAEDVLEVRYEELVKRPKGTTERVCSFLGLDFDPAMLSYHKTNRSEYSSYYSKVHNKLAQPPNRDRIEAWRSHLSNRQQSLIESLCAQTMLLLDYRPDKSPKRTSNSYTTYLKFQRRVGFLRQLLYYLIYRPRYITCNLRRKVALKLFFKGLSDVNY